MILRTLPTQLLSRIASRRRRWEIYRTPFYRRYPHNGAVTVFDVDRKAYIDIELGFFYNAIGKAGHSTAIGNLARMKFGDDVSSRHAKKATFLRPSQLRLQQMARFDDLFRFTFVRNPYSRVLSAYLDKIARNKIYPNALRRSKSSPPTFYEFCLYLDDGGLRDQHHWAPQTELLLIPVSDFDLLGKLENFDNDFEIVRGRLLGEQDNFDVRNHDSHRTDSNKKLLQYYDDRTVEIISRLFRADFRELGYDPEMT